ncbi:MAG: potassium-transporting ATPase subunit C [Planctomycetes bacterium]|nr:potassium-transporting ATPase subunit C [Planctomycetota bacterium]
MSMILTSLRLAVITVLVCVPGYTALILGFAQLATPHTANGSLLTSADGEAVVGSHLLAQAFTQPRYFWPRPSAVGYHAAGAGGSNKSPTSTDVTDRAQQLVAAYGATSDQPLPADLAAASGSGLDPHVTERAALYQAARVAAARGRPRAEIERIVRGLAFAPGGFFAGERIVNVLELNRALER